MRGEASLVGVLLVIVALVAWVSWRLRRAHLRGLVNDAASGGDSPFVEHRFSQGYPLLGLFLLIVLCGTLAGMLAPAVRSTLASGGGSEAVLPGLLGIGVGSLFGVGIGLYHHRRLLGIGWGALSGAVLGAIGGPLCLLPERELPGVLLVSAVGSVLLVALAAVGRIRRDEM